MTKCYKCGGETKPKEVNWTVNFGGHDIVHPVMADVCRECGEWTLSAQDVERLELQSAIQALGGFLLTGPILREVRKALGLKQTELAEKLGVAWETVSRWESEKRPMELWVKAALMGLVIEALLPHQERMFAEVAQKQDEASRLIEQYDAEFKATMAVLRGR